MNYGFSPSDFKVKEFVIKTTNKMAYNDLIKLFLDRINKEREGTKYEPLKFMAVKSKCAGIKKIEELQAFFADCEKARNFSEYFFYQLDPKKFKKVIHKTTK